MNSQTARRPETKRPVRSNKTKKYSRQTARFEGRRDGKPLIFGWGGHLSHSQKVQLQRRATWAAAIAFAVIIVAVIVGFWVNINIITPGLAITTVNGHGIPQSLYRKMVAYQAEVANNQLNGPHGLIAERNSLKQQVNAATKTTNDLTTSINKLVKQIAALPAGSSAQRTSLNNQLASQRAQFQTAQKKLDSLNQQYTNLTSNQIAQAQENYNQSQIGNTSVIWLQNDELIREWLANQSSAVQAKINPTASQLAQTLASFKANLPTGTSYSAFLSKDGVSDSDIQAMMTIKLRRDNMQNYLASQIKSPTYQVLAREMVIDTKQHAQSLLKQLNHGADFGKLAKANSSDANTSSQGGYLGWLARGQYAQTYDAALVENWLFNPNRKLNELSPILFQNGSYIIAQVLGIDPSRPLSASALETLKTNALSNWLLQQEALPGVTETTANQTMLLDTNNMPPGLPLAAPANSVPGTNGLSAP
jgi:parvulin-like peptidyl-prolyl isomerase